MDARLQKCCVPGCWQYQGKQEKGRRRGRLKLENICNFQIVSAFRLRKRRQAHLSFNMCLLYLCFVFVFAASRLSVGSHWGRFLLNIITWWYFDVLFIKERIESAHTFLPCKFSLHFVEVLSRYLSWQCLDTSLHAKIPSFLILELFARIMNSSWPFQFQGAFCCCLVFPYTLKQFR